MVGKTLLQILFVSLLILIASFVVAAPFGLLWFFLFIPLVYFVNVTRKIRLVKKKLQADGFIATKSFEWMLGCGILVDERNRKVALLDEDKVVVASYDDRPVLQVSSSILDDSGVTKSVGISISFVQKATGYRYARTFSCVPVSVFTEIEGFWKDAELVIAS